MGSPGVGGDLANGLTWEVADGELSDTWILWEISRIERELIFPGCWKWERELDEAILDIQTSGFIVCMNQ